MKIKVTQKLQPPEQSLKLLIEVIDTGVGIKEEDHPKLFKLFGFLTNTMEINADGVGVGLYICKKIANKLGGDITCESKLNKGTTFSYIVPL